MKAYMRAWTTFQSHRVLQRLIEQDLKRVEVSKSPHNPPESPEMLDMEVVVALEQHERDT